MHGIVKARTVLGTLMLAALAGTAAERTWYDPTFYEPSAEVVTPHIAWQKPTAGARPRVLFITHRNAMREVIEIAQRFAMDYRVFACESPQKFGETGLGVDASWRLVRGNSAEELAERLRQVLTAEVDVIVLGNIKWDELPIDCRYEILKKVKAGTGLVGHLPAGRDEYLRRILGDREFHWRWGLWSGAAKDIPDYFGVGVFEGATDTAAAHSGRASLRIVGKEVRKGSREAPRGGYSPGAVKLEPETEYTFSMWTKTTGLPEGGAQVSLHPQSRGVAVPVSADWVQTTATFKTGPGEQSSGVYLLNYQVGTVWYDDVSLVKAGDAHNLLPNPGFENPGPVPAQVPAAVPLAALPAYAAHAEAAAFAAREIETATFGRGRLGFLRAAVPQHQMLTPGPLGPVQDCLLDYDYYLALAIKLIRWGSGRDPAVQVSTPGTGLLALARASLSDTPLEFHLAAGEAAAGLRTELCVRNRRNRVWYTEQRDLKLAAGETVLRFALPPLPHGSYFADLWVRRGDAVVDFGSVGLVVTHPVHLGTVALARESFAQREPLSGSVGVEAFEPGCLVHFAATDRHGRLVAESSVPVDGPHVSFSLPMPAALTLVGHLEVELRQGAAVLDVRSVDYTINDLRPDRQDALFVMWESYPADFIGPRMAESFTRNGIEAQYGGARAAGYCPYANQWWLPYAIRFTDRKTDWYQERATRQSDDLVRDPCLTDPAYRETVRKSLLATTHAGRATSTSDFTLGDENLFVSGAFDLCFSPTCVADFRRWVREEHADLAQLNAAWGTAYATWDEVKPATLAEARKSGNPAPWVAHRRHMDSVWAGMHAFSRDVIREVVPQARVGYEGSDSHVSTYLAADYWKLSRAMDLNNIYYRDFLSLAWRDFAPEGMLLGAGWFGGYPGNRNEPFMRWFPWRTLFKGSNSFWVWCGYGNAGSVMAFDLSLYPFFKAACQEVAQIKSGPAKLLITSQRAHDGVAVLYSASSVHVSTATPDFPEMDGTLNATVQLLHDIGIECRVLSYAELAAGRLSHDEFKLLVMPCSQALSRPEAEAVRRFVEAGGSVLADLRPAITDENGRGAGKGALDDVFGVVQSPVFRKGQAALPDLGLTGLTCDASLAPGAGTAAAMAGSAPLLVANRFGKGRTLLLNFALTPYAKLPAAKGADFADWPAGAPWRAFLRQPLAEAGVRCPVTVEPELPHVEVSRFRSGEAEYVGIIQGLPRPTLEYTNRTAPAPAASPVTLSFGRQAWVYDVRRGKSLGRTERVRTDLTPGVATLYALLPYKVRGVDLSLPRRAAPGAEVTAELTVSVGAPAAGRHVVRVDVTSPAGTAQPHYARNVLCDAGRGTFVLTFALNDSPGKWRITARDVASGATESVTLRLDPK